jgi:cytochrome c-type biogenesis protein CcmF
MLASIGDISLILSMILSGYGSVAIILRKFNPNFANKQIKILSYLQFICLTIAFFSLIYCFAISDFSVLLVANHSHQLKPLLYKITGSWGNHEGSMLLWVWELSLITILYLKISNATPSFKTSVLSIQLLIIFALTSFINLTSNPFIKLLQIPESGAGLNPLLQDIGLASHPPLLYLGYVLFSIPFSSILAMLLYNKEYNNIAQHIRPWALAAWGFLTIGIALGSSWAYRELGWGGFWFWDPVENASLMPWLVGAALIHSLILFDKQKIALHWCCLLAISSFNLSLLGTFLVRSNILTSVHSFASDPKRGIVILFLFSIFSIGSILIYLINSAKLKSTQLSTLTPRASFIIINNILLTVSCFTIILGTLYPIFYQLITEKHITIGAPYYASTFIPIIIPNLLFATIGPHLNQFNLKPLYYIALAVIILAIIYFYKWQISLITIICLAFSLLLFLGTLILWIKQLKHPNKAIGAIFSHMGVAILVASIAIVSEYQQQSEVILKLYDKTHIAGFNITLSDINYLHGANYFARCAKLKVNKGATHLTWLKPESRFYPVEQSNTTESSIYSTIFYDLYAAIGEYDEKNKSLLLRIYYKPFMSWVWVGCAFMGFGAIFSAFKKLIVR